MNTDWFLIPFIIILALLAFIKVNYKGYIKQILLSTFNYPISSAIYKETKKNKPKSAHILFLIFLFSSVIFSFQLFHKFLPEVTNKHFFLIYGITLIFILGLTVANKLTNYISGKVFLYSELSKEYNHNISVFNQSFGIIIFPVTILISFTNTPNIFIYSGIVLFIAMYLLRIIRLIKININKQVNLFYMFLYLCTLEIIPMLYIIKFFVMI